MSSNALNTFPGSVVVMRQHEVYIREAWDDDWELVPYLHCERVIERLGQPVEIALTYEAGEIKREDSYEFASFEPLNIVGSFVKVEVVPLDEDDDEEPMRWYGEVVSDARQVGSGLGTQTRPMTQSFLALGLEHRLALSTVRGSYVGKASTTGVQIDTPLVWNRSPGNAPGDQKNLLFQEPGNADSIVFDWTVNAPPRDVWHIDDVVKYLLSRYVDPLADDAPFRPFPTSGGVGEFLASTPAPAVVAEGQSVLAILNFLLRPERGVGWRLKFDDDADSGSAGPLIEVFSQVQTAVTVGDRTLPASAQQVDLDVTGRHGVLDLVLVEDASLRYSAVVVRGEPVLSCFSLSYTDSTLAAGWTATQASAYLSAATATTDERNKNDRKRQQMVAWSRFVVPEDWDQKAGDGAGGTKTVVNPRILSTGELHETLTGNIRRSGWGLQFEPWIPIKEADIGTAERPYYKRPMVFVQDADAGTPAKFLDVQRHLRTDAPHALVSPLDDALGFEVRFEPPHVLGLNGFSASTSTIYPAVFDWTKMIVTGAVRLDVRCSVEQAIEGNEGRPKLYIDVPGAELWIVNAGTVIGLEDDGQPKRYTSDRVVRDDRAKLKSELAMAIAYYGTPRRGMSVTLANVTLAPPLGAFVKKVIETVGDRTDEGIVNATVQERQFDLAQGITRVIAGPMRPTFSNGGAS